MDISLGLFVALPQISGSRSDTDTRSASKNVLSRGEVCIEKDGTSDYFIVTQRDLSHKRLFSPLSV